MTPLLTVLDVGTHSILSLLVRKENGSGLDVLDQQSRIARLGRGVKRTGLIKDEAVALAVKILADFRTRSLEQGVSSIVAVGTEVFRQAANRESVLETIARETGIRIEVLDDEEEARWGFWGAVWGRDWELPTVVADIGGGSSEFVLGDSSGIREWVSLKTGCVEMTESILKSDPPTDSEWEQARSFTTSLFRTSGFSGFGSAHTLTGVGGTMTTLAASALDLKKYDGRRVDGRVLSQNTLAGLIETLRHLPLLRRRDMLPTDPERAEVILGGSAILTALLETSGCDRIMISDRGLRFGIALRTFGLAPNHILVPEVKP